MSHVEVYIKPGYTVASREGIGVSVYTIDLSGLYCVLRPQLPFDLAAAMVSFTKNHNGAPYGWKTLAGFAGVSLADDGEDCSEFACNFYRDGCFEPFNSGIPSRMVAPAHFLFIHPTVMAKVWPVATPPPAMAPAP